jgi:hypothetical protein
MIRNVRISSLLLAIALRAYLLWRAWSATGSARREVLDLAWFLAQSTWSAMLALLCFVSIFNPSRFSSGVIIASGLWTGFFLFTASNRALNLGNFDLMQVLPSYLTLLFTMLGATLSLFVRRGRAGLPAQEGPVVLPGAAPRVVVPEPQAARQQPQPQPQTQTRPRAAPVAAPQPSPPAAPPPAPSPASPPPPAPPPPTPPPPPPTPPPPPPAPPPPPPPPSVPVPQDVGLRLLAALTLLPMTADEVVALRERAIGCTGDYRDLPEAAALGAGVLDALEYEHPQFYARTDARPLLQGFLRALLQRPAELVWPERGSPSRGHDVITEDSGQVSELVRPGFAYLGAGGERVLCPALVRAEPTGA